MFQLIQPHVGQELRPATTRDRVRKLTLVLAAIVALVLLAAPASAATTVRTSLTFVEGFPQQVGCTAVNGFCGTGQVVPFGQASEGANWLGLERSSSPVDPRMSAKSRVHGISAPPGPKRSMALKQPTHSVGFLSQGRTPRGRTSMPPRPLNGPPQSLQRGLGKRRKRPRSGSKCALGSVSANLHHASLPSGRMQERYARG